MEQVKRYWDYWKFPLIIVLCILFFIKGLSYSFYPLLIAFFCAYLVLPLINRLEKKGLPRGLSSIGILLLMLVGVFIVLFFLLPFLIKEINLFVKAVPEMFNSTVNFTNGLLERWNFTYRLQSEDVFNQKYISQFMSGLSKKEATALSSLFSSAFSNILRFILTFFTVCLLPVFFYYCVDKYESIVSEFKRYLPKRYIDWIAEFLAVVHDSFGKFFRGQLIVSLILACLYAIGLSIAGLKFGILIGVMTGLFGLIPYFGHGIGILSSLTSILMHDSGMGTIVGVIIVFAILIMVESYILTPKIVGGKVGLNAFTTLLALLVFGEFFGFIGIFIAIPTTCMLKFYYERFLLSYQKTPFFNKSS